MAGYGWVLNFANSIVGVGVLAMPYCFYKCGIILAALMIICSSIMTKKTCEFLLRTASFTRKTTFEQIALHVYGPMGKLVTEISIIGLLLGTLVAFQVVIGDLAPAIVHDFIGLQETWTLRTLLMITSSGAILPLCFLRVSSLSSLNAASMAFYSIFIAITICFALPTIYSFRWFYEVNLWRTESFFNCLPIISIAFTCQTQVFVMYNALPDPSMKAMNDIIDKAISLVASIYIIVGTFGYLAFYESGIHGDILASFPQGFITNFIKLGFWASVIISFPLMVFPVRVSINSLLYSQNKQGVLHDVISSASDYIAPDKFMYITVSLVTGTLTVGILVPHIEVVLSITGALVGTFLCYVFPALLYLMGCPKDGLRKLAQVIVVVSSIIMIISTTTVMISISDPREPHHGAEHKNDIGIQPPVPIPTVLPKPVEGMRPAHEDDIKNNLVENVHIANKEEKMKDVSDNEIVKKENENILNNQHENVIVTLPEKNEEVKKEENLEKLVGLNIKKSEKIDPPIKEREKIESIQIRHKLSTITEQQAKEVQNVENSALKKESLSGNSIAGVKKEQDTMHDGQEMLETNLINNHDSNRKQDGSNVVNIHKQNGTIKEEKYGNIDLNAKVREEKDAKKSPAELGDKNLGREILSN